MCRTFYAIRHGTRESFGRLSRICSADHKCNEFSTCKRTLAKHPKGPCGDHRRVANVRFLGRRDRRHRATYAAVGGGRWSLFSVCMVRNVNFLFARKSSRQQPIPKISTAHPRSYILPLAILFCDLQVSVLRQSPPVSPGQDGTDSSRMRLHAKGASGTGYMLPERCTHTHTHTHTHTQTHTRTKQTARS